MTTQKRPTTARKVTPKSEKKRTSELDTGVKFTIDEDVFEVRIGDVTPNLAREIRKATGSSFNSLMAEISSDPDVDTISTFVWIARRIRGEDVALDDVSIPYAVMLSDGFDIDVAGAPEVDDQGPEA